MTAHYVVRSLAMSLAGGFIGAFLLRLGFTLTVAVGLYGLLYLTRFVMRFAAAAIVRRIGIRGGLLAGATLGAIQFLPLLHADRLGWLVTWILIVCAGESLYFPVYHAASAVTGGDACRGQQMGSRLLIATVISIAGPLAGGALLAGAGPFAGFSLASLICLGSVLPLLWLGEIDVGPLPTMGQAARLVDGVGVAAFAADGWISAGTSIAWSMILFTSLGSSFGYFGVANSVAAIAGAVIGVLSGRCCDHGRSERVRRWVTTGLLTGVALRAAAAWQPELALVANTLGAAITGIYCPLLMSVVYARADRTGEAYHFHLCAEAGWDVGMICGCGLTAGLLWSGLQAPLAVVPAALGILAVSRCLRAGMSPRGDRAMVSAPDRLRGSTRAARRAAPGSNRRPLRDAAAQPPFHGGDYAAPHAAPAASAHLRAAST